MQVIEKMRNEINRGILPRPGDMVDDFAIAQLLLSYFVEMPEPLLTNELYSEFYSYHRSQSAVRLNTASDDPAAKNDACMKLKAIIAKLPVENAVTIYYLVKLLHLWEDASGEKKVVLPLLQQLLMRPNDNLSMSQLSISNDVVETITYQIYTMIDDLDFPKDAEAEANYTRPVVTYNASVLPVTVFSPEVTREIVDSVVNEKPLTDLEANDSRSGSVPVKRAIIARSKGAGGTESSGSGRSTSSDGDSNVSGQNEGSEDNSSSSSSSSHHTILSLFHRKKKDNSQSARAAVRESSSSNNLTGSSISSSSISSSTSSSTTTSFTPTPSAPVTTPAATSAAAPTSELSTSPQAIRPMLSNMPATSAQTIPMMPLSNPSGSQQQQPIDFSQLSSMPMDSSAPYMLSLGSIPRMPLAQTDDSEVFMDMSDLTDFVPDDLVPQSAPTPQGAPAPFTFDPSLPPMPMSPIVPQSLNSGGAASQR